MTDAEADGRLHDLERELARRQTEAGYQQIEAGLVRQRLKETLAIAMRLIGHAADEFEIAHDGMADGIGYAEQ